MNHTTTQVPVINVTQALREERDRALESLETLVHSLECEHDSEACRLEDCASCEALFAARGVLAETPKCAIAGGAA